MSLITDALKRAQEQRQASQSDDRARRMLRGSGPLRVETRDRPGPTRPLALAAGAVVVAVVLFGVAVVLSPRAEDAGAAGREGLAEARAEVGGGSADVGDMRDVGDVAAADVPVQTPGYRTPPMAAEGDGAAGGRTSEVGLREESGAVVAPSAGSRAGPDPGSGAGTGSRAGTGPAATGGPVSGSGDGVVREEASSFRMTVSGGGTGRTPEASFGLALGAHRAGELERAAGLYREALEGRPGDPEIWNNLGVVYRGLSLPDEALGAFRSAVEADPGYAPAWSNVGLMLEAMGRGGEAIEAYREALRRDPGNTGAKVNLANRYQALGMGAEAEGLLREALRDDPSLPEAHYALARVLEEGGDVVEAERHYRLFLELGRGRFPVLESRVREHLSGLSAGSSPGGGRP